MGEKLDYYVVFVVGGQYGSVVVKGPMETYEHVMTVRTEIAKAVGVEESLDTVQVINWKRIE